jgi:multidrug transporter EmrE-like cation transporter
MGHIYVFSTLMLTVYGQLIVKWRVAQAGFMPTNLAGKIWFMAGLLSDPWIISVLLAAFLAALSWMAAMTKFDLSYAYPFMSLAFVLVMLISAALFHETITLAKVLGVVLVVAGIIISSRG